MRCLSLGVFAEGPTDFDFLAPLAVRVAADFIRSRLHPAEIVDPWRVPSRPSERFADVIAQHAFLDAIVVHTDGRGDPDRARRERIEPWFTAAGGVFDGRTRALVAAVPVHETEAWMLCDADALNRALGTRLSARELGLPDPPHLVESIHDPKRQLARSHQRAVGKRRARRLGIQPLYRRLGQESGLERLSSVPAFRLFRDDLCSALEHLGF